MSFSILPSAVTQGVLASDVAASVGTFTTGYPSGKDKGNFFLAVGHKLTINQTVFYYPVDFDVTLGAGPSGTITVTNKTTAAWLATSTWRLQLEERGDRTQLDIPLQSPNAQVSTVGGSTYSIDARFALIPSTTEAYLDLITLGAPIALNTTGVALAQAVGTPALAASLQINGSLASAGTVTLDVPRGLQTVSSSGSDTTQVVTVTGTDVYGYTMSEAMTITGTTPVLGLKAFKRVLRAASSLSFVGNVSIGTTDKLGLPVFMPDTGYLLKEMRDGKPIGGGGTAQVPFFISAVALAAGTPQEVISPISGFVTQARGIVTDSTITTGGNIGFFIGTTAITGLSLVFAGGAVPGTIVSDTPTTALSATTVVTAGQRMTITPDASFATSGAVNGYIDVSGQNGALVPGIRTAGGSTTTTGDVRGTYTPALACDGTSVIDLVVVVGDRYAGIRQA